MRIHHAVAEALTRKKIDSFIEWLKERNDSNILETFMSSKELKELQGEPTNESFKSCELAATRIINSFEEFKQIIRNAENSSMTAFWQSYLDMFELLLQFQKSIKSRNWKLHLHPALVPCLLSSQLCSTLFVLLGITATPSGYPSILV